MQGKKIRMRLRLRSKFILITSVTLLFSIGLYTSINLGYFLRIYNEREIERVFAQTQDLRTVIEELLEIGIALDEMDGIDRMCMKIVNSLSLARYCFIIDNHGKMLYKHERNFPDTFANDALTPVIIKSMGPLLLKSRLQHESLYDFSFPLLIPANSKKVGSIRIGASAAIIDREVTQLVINNSLSGLVFIIVAGLIVFFMIHLNIIKYIKELLDAMLKFGNGRLQSRVLIKSRDEIGDIASSFNNMADNILELFEERKKNLGAMEEINRKLMEASDALWGEMQLAKKIQTVLLPEKPGIAGYEISAHMTPTDMVGGDYYDVITVDNYHWLVIGDVSGHGISAGLVMMMAQTAVRTVLYHDPGISPRDLLTVINRTMNYNIKKLKDTKYMTITVIACLDNAQFHYSGLHLPLLLYRALSGTVEILDTRGMWIGILKDINHINKVDSFTLEPDDVLLLYTDGIIEARDKNSRIFSLEKLVACFKANCIHPVDAIRDSILAELEKYETDDDVSMLIVKRK